MPLHINNISKRFGSLVVFDQLTLTAEANRLTCILGPSGCGKSTLLNIISGLIKPDAGDLEGFAGQPVSYIFQEPRLLPWKTVGGNLDFVLKDQLTSSERQEKIQRYLEMVELSAFADYYPYQLSGGMRQRVAIARAFAYPSSLLLMDEPFTGLDLSLKQTLITAFIRLWALDQRTVFFVTHDINEALLLGDDILILTNRPAQVKSRLSLSLPQTERELENPVLTGYYKELYQQITIN
ncbi:MAG: ABC transporter ATP-binding protein [Methylocystaceae bacterium]